NKYYENDARAILREYSTASGRKEQLQKMFLKALSGMGLEDKVALFEGEVENETDISNYNIKWTRKTLNKKKLERTPCN
ncbi:hypothetical protein, partial [Flavobacterium sp. U410]